MNGILTMEERITKQQLQKLYGVNRKTIEDWVQNYNLPMIQISPYKRFVRKKDLLEWEETKMVGQLLILKLFLFTNIKLS